MDLKRKIKQVKEYLKLASIKGTGYAFWLASKETKIEYGCKIRIFYKYWHPFILVGLGMILNLVVIYALFCIIPMAKEAKEWIDAKEFRLFCFN